MKHMRSAHCDDEWSSTEIVHKSSLSTDEEAVKKTQGQESTDEDSGTLGWPIFPLQLEGNFRRQDASTSRTVGSRG